MKTNSNDLKSSKKKKVYGDPEYSENEDIYSREKKESFNDDELPKKQDGQISAPLDEGLDIPGDELDDADEKIGEEDEENNYYSLGGDDHNDLDEDEDE